MPKTYDLDDYEAKAIEDYRSKKKAKQAQAPAQAPAPKSLEIEEDREDPKDPKAPHETEEYEYKCSACQHEFNGQPEKCPNCQEALEW